MTLFDVHKMQHDLNLFASLLTQAAGDLSEIDAQVFCNKVP